jgi:hypothetical protein
MRAEVKVMDCKFCRYPEGSVGHRVECLGESIPPPAPIAIFEGMRRHLLAARDEVSDAWNELRTIRVGERLDLPARRELIDLADAIRDQGAALVIDAGKLRDQISRGSARGGRRPADALFPPCEAG